MIIWYIQHTLFITENQAQKSLFLICKTTKSTASLLEAVPYMKPSRTLHRYQLNFTDKGYTTKTPLKSSSCPRINKNLILQFIHLFFFAE